jgi:uncharacterized protein
MPESYLFWFWVVPATPIAAAAALRLPQNRSLIVTTVVGLLALIVYYTASWGALSVLVQWQGATLPTGNQARYLQLMQDGWLTLAMVVASPFTVLVVLVAIWVRRESVSDYLALVWPARLELARGLVMNFALLFAWSVAGQMTGHKTPEIMVLEFQSAQQNSWFGLLLISLCVAAPLTEELVVRGFLFRGLSQSFLGPVGAIVLTSAAWAAIHIQYDLFGKSEIFTIGLLYGYLRYRSGSTWLTALIHAATNLLILMELAAFVAPV